MKLENLILMVKLDMYQSVAMEDNYVILKLEYETMKKKKNFWHSCQ